MEGQVDSGRQDPRSNPTAGSPGWLLRAVLTLACLSAVALAWQAAPGGASRPADGRSLWKPAPGTTWQWQIVGKVKRPFRPVDMYDIDLQDAVPAPRNVRVPGFGVVRWPRGINAGVIEDLHDAGKVVICYLDSGAWEAYRPDASLFPGRPGWSKGDPKSDVILRNTGWEKENWLDIRPGQRRKFAPIIWARFKLAAAIGCDGVEPDQNNPIGNNPGPRITRAAEKSWYLQVARQAHARGLSVGMKNGVEVTDMHTAAAFDWNLNEECFFFRECDRLKPFVRVGKVVFQTEYADDWRRRKREYRNLQTLSGKVCPEARTREGFSTLIKRFVPDASFFPCWPQTSGPRRSSPRSRLAILAPPATLAP